VAPLALATVAIVSSLAIIVIQLALSVDYPGWYFVGWLATPLAILIFLGWDAVAQRAGLSDPWFDARPGYSRLIRVIAVAGLAVGGFHIVKLGIALGTAAVSAGWFG